MGPVRAHPWIVRPLGGALRALGGVQVQARDKLCPDGPRSARTGRGLGPEQVNKGIWRDAALQQPDTWGYEV